MRGDPLFQETEKPSTLPVPAGDDFEVTFTVRAKDSEEAKDRLAGVLSGERLRRLQQTFPMKVKRRHDN